MANPNLYTCNLKAKHEWYDDWQVKKRLKPYIEYLDLVKKHYKKTEIILDYKRRPPQTNSRDYKRRPPQTNSPCWINLGELKDNELRQIYDTDIEHVYEFNPDRDAKNKFKSENKIKIIKRRAKQKALQLEREPSKPQLVIRRDFYQIQKQIDAAWTLLGKPTGEYMPLLKLFHKFNVEWPAVDEQDIDEWFILNREADGVLEQREFVKKALGTPDFAFLEGPPGSGKTTVLCELILQLVSRGKRVLFCASTHVAVDNLLERLVDENAKPAADLIPLRIGLSDKISEKTEHYKHDEFVKTVKNKLTRHLSGQKPASRSQKALLNVLEGNDDTIGQIARDCANLVCGTTIGILGHPDIKNGSLRRFDVMIIDEASKTTLQEFLVPALHANRWIIAGDNKQLDPYTDDKEIAVQVDSCIEKELGEVCLDVFMANRRRHATIVVTNDEDLKDRYLRQCEKFGVKLHDADTSGVEIDFGSDQIVIGSPTSISRLGPPGQYATIRNCDQLLNRPKQEKNNYRLEQWKLKCREQNRENNTWSEQMGWRIKFRISNTTQYKDEQRIKNEIDNLMPVEGTDEVGTRLDGVKAIALPSVLECLEKGTGTVAGIPARNFEDRHVLLVWQYRMHPDIAAFSHKHVYGGEALRTPVDMESKRRWSYDEYRNRSVWIDVRGKTDQNSRSPSNEKEAKQIVKELEKFYAYACNDPKPDGTPWTIAVLSFYAGQVEGLKKHMQKFTGQQGPHSFKMPPIDIELRTVDSFQGHEADLVFLSLAKGRPTIFLNHLNRINVAITRARYQCVIVGNKGAMSKSDPPLRDLADETRDQIQV